MNAYIAVDIGGTQIRAACYPEEGITPLSITRIATKHPAVSPLGRLYESIETVWPSDQKVRGIGIASPGPLNPFEGKILVTPNIPGWENLPICNSITERFSVPAYLGNDANLAALAEWKFGAGRGYHDLVYLTISTGIGSGVIIEDRLLLGSNGLASELGHVTICNDGPACPCGQHGHLEAVASGTAIAHWVEQELENGVESTIPRGKHLSGKELYDAAQNGDRLAIDAFKRAGNYIGQAIANILHIFNPSIVIIGGGVSQSGALLFEPIRESIHKHVMTPYHLEGLILTQAIFGDDVGLIGALTLIRNQSQIDD